MRVNRKELLRALVQAVRFTSKYRPHVLLETGGPLLYVKSTDLETYFQTYIDGTGGPDRGFRVLVNAKDARDLVRTLINTEVTVEDIPDSLNVQIGGARLTGDDPEKFPSLPEPRRGAADFNLGAADFARMIKETVYAAAREDSRYSINGILIEQKRNVLSLIATDGRRLAVTKVDGMGDDDFSAIVPASAMNYLRMCLGKLDSLKVDIEENHVWFLFGDSVITIRRMEARFPDYSAVIPTGLPVRAYVDRKELERALKQLLIYTPKDVPAVKFEVAQGELTLSAEDPERGAGSVTLDVIREGEGVIHLNPNYLLDAVKASDSPDVRLDFGDDGGPVVWEMGFLYVQMPISVKA